MSDVQPNPEKGFLLKEIKRLVDRNEALLKQAEAEDRDPTTEEDAEYKANNTQILERKNRVEQIERHEARREELKALGSVTEVATPEAVEVQAKTAGEAFVRSKEYRAIREAAKTDGFPRFETPTIEMKAVGDPVLESTGDNNTAIQPTWFGLETPGLVQYPLRVADVMNVVPLADGNTAYWPIVTTRTISDMTSTAEGENKAGTEYAFDQTSAALAKWTAFATVSEEFFQDAPSITNYINTDLGIMALQKEELAIVTALYTASTTAADGSSLQGSPIGYDAVAEAISMVEIAGGTPNVILMHPTDAARLATERQVAGTGEYFSGGPYQTANGAPLWGQVRVVKTTAVPEYTALVGDFSRGARLFRKGGLRVESSNSHDDYFRKNLVAIRAEIRSVTGVSYPEFFVEVFLGS